LPKPAPKKVAMVQAQRVFRAAGAGLAVLGVGLVFIGVFLLAAAKVFENLGVEDGRTDLVDAHGPFAEIDLAATVAAEGKVLVCVADEHSAGRAAENLSRFFSGSHHS